MLLPCIISSTDTGDVLAFDLTEIMKLHQEMFSLLAPDLGAIIDSFSHSGERRSVQRYITGNPRIDKYMEYG